MTVSINGHHDMIVSANGHDDMISGINGWDGHDDMTVSMMIDGIMTVSIND
jgi:hypothetical protein